MPYGLCSSADCWCPYVRSEKGEFDTSPRTGGPHSASLQSKSKEIHIVLGGLQSQTVSLPSKAFIWCSISCIYKICVATCLSSYVYSIYASFIWCLLFLVCLNSSNCIYHYSLIEYNFNLLQFFLWFTTGIHSQLTKRCKQPTGNSSLWGLLMILSPSKAPKSTSFTVSCHGNTGWNTFICYGKTGFCDLLHLYLQTFVTFCFECHVK